MKMIKNYKHQVASHCESGSLRNILNFSGLNISEPLLFGIGSGIVFAYMKNIKGPAGFPVTAVRLPMGSIVKNVEKLLNIDMFIKKFKTPEQAINFATEKINEGKPVLACVEMFYMRYLPDFMRIHAPFHFIVLIGREDDIFYVSDPYYQDIGKLHIEDLKSAWATGAKFANDNLLVYINNVPQSIEWKDILIKSIKRSCVNIIIPVVGNFLPMFGANGIKLYAKEMLKWTKKYKAFQLKEGMLGSANIFEEQGTGGGAFRFLYGAFLQEASELLKSEKLKNYSKEMINNGEKWRDISREMIKVAKEIPVKTSDYDIWFKNNGENFNNKIIKISNLFIERANFELDFSKRLLADLNNLS